LVINGDETNALFVNRARVTKDRCGNKRVRVIGVGSDKAQITSTLFANEEGDMLPYQNIWAGKTNKCHPPKHLKRDGVLWSNTISHWQSEKTYLEVMKEIVVPYRLRTIARLGLLSDQKLLLKHDLHFTHKAEEILNFCNENHIVLLFVPAKCTDVLQECDIIINSTYKSALKRAFRDWLVQLFHEHLAAGKNAETFNPKLTYGALKPLMPEWLHSAWEALRTPEMKESIAKCFRDDGLFGTMRDPLTIARIREQQDAVNVLSTLNAVPAGVEVDEDRVEDIIAQDEDLEQEILWHLGDISLEQDDDDDDDDDIADDDDHAADDADADVFSNK
jgi:hypothetical protein